MKDLTGGGHGGGSLYGGLGSDVVNGGVGNDWLKDRDRGADGFRGDGGAPLIISPGLPRVAPVRDPVLEHIGLCRLAAGAA